MLTDNWCVLKKACLQFHVWKVSLQICRPIKHCLADIKVHKGVYKQCVLKGTLIFVFSFSLTCYISWLQPKSIGSYIHTITVSKGFKGKSGIFLLTWCRNHKAPGIYIIVKSYTVVRGCIQNCIYFLKTFAVQKETQNKIMKMKCI